MGLFLTAGIFGVLIFFYINFDYTSPLDGKCCKSRFP